MPFEPLGAATVVDQGPGTLRLHAGATTVEVAALAPDLLRGGMFPDGLPPDYRSEAIAVELEPLPSLETGAASPSCGCGCCRTSAGSSRRPRAPGRRSCARCPEVIVTLR